ncbi:MAG: peptide-methionine (R)-S-oxide reductase, partial [Methanobacteriota archaeon]
MKPPEAELKKRLTPMEFEVTQACGTEPPCTGKYSNHEGKGMYHCVV